MPQVTTIALKPGAEIWNGSALYPNAVLLMLANASSNILGSKYSDKLAVTTTDTDAIDQTQQ